MRLLIILCFTTLFLCTECGLVKNIFGAVSNEVHKITDGNIIKNMVQIVHNETKGIAEDLGDLLHINNKHNNNNEKKPTEIDKDEKNKVIPNSTRKPAISKDSTAKTSRDEIIHTDISNNQDIKTHSATEATDNEIPNNSNQAVDYTQTSSESGDTSKLVFKEEGFNYGEGVISPRIARDIKDEKQDAVTEQMIENEEKEKEKKYSTGDDIIYNNMNVKDIFLSNDNFDEIVETIVIGDCPDGLELSVNGSCIETSTEIQGRKKGKNRANFVGGCLYGFGKADDGTCQEIIYD